MDSLGDYIYIILIAVAGISSLLKNKKKATDNSAPKTSKRSWEDILKELTPVEEEPETYEEIIEPAPVIVEATKIMSYETIEDSSKLRSKKTVTSNNTSNKKTETKIESQVENLEPAFSISSVNDARRAFIYSEIFNRKY